MPSVQEKKEILPLYEEYAKIDNQLKSLKYQKLSKTLLISCARNVVPSADTTTPHKKLSPKRGASQQLDMQAIKEMAAKHSNSQLKPKQELKTDEGIQENEELNDSSPQTSVCTETDTRQTEKVSSATTQEEPCTNLKQEAIEEAKIEEMNDCAFTSLTQEAPKNEANSRVLESSQDEATKAGSGDTSEEPNDNTDDEKMKEISCLMPNETQLNVGPGETLEHDEVVNQLSEAIPEERPPSETKQTDALPSSDAIEIKETNESIISEAPEEIHTTLEWIQLEFNLLDTAATLDNNERLQTIAKALHTSMGDVAPFLRVDSVENDSPAAQAGLIAGDLIARFGHIHVNEKQSHGALIRDVVRFAHYMSLLITLLLGDVSK